MANSVEHIICLVLFYYEDIFLRHLHISNVLYTDLAFEVFFGLGWTLYINKTSLTYWTSDNTIAIENITEIDQNEPHQIRDGCKIYFPLSPKICLLMYDPSFYKYPNKIFETDIQSVIEKKYVTGRQLIETSFLI